MDEKTLSRIVTAPLDVQEKLGLPGFGSRGLRDNDVRENSPTNRAEQRFDARGRAVKTRGSSYQKVYIKR